MYLLRRVVHEDPDTYAVSFTNPESTDAQPPVITATAQGVADTFDTSFFSWVKLEKYQLTSAFPAITGPLYTRSETGEPYEYLIVEAGPLSADQGPSIFEMPVRGYTTTVNQTTHTVTNTLNMASLTLIKRDAISGTALAGAEFRVSHLTDTGITTSIYTTGTDGRILLTGLVPQSREPFSGSTVSHTANVYTIQEIRPPLGYLAGSTLYTAVVDAYGILQLYSHYEGPNSSSNVLATNYSTGVSGSFLTVPNTSMAIPPIQKMVNGSTGAVL